MTHKVSVYNTLSRKKEIFEPLNPPFAGMYVCGPTVYGDAHLGHARPAVTFDLVFRYLSHIGYKVRYVRNITDVGHLENDADEGEDKIAKKAKVEQLEPMEVAQYFTDRYHHNMDQLNVKRPSIEPRASGHILEQIRMTEKIIANGYAYVSNGSVYFDVEKYGKSHHYGILSGRVLEELMAGAGTRELEGQDEKKSPADFALWKKAAPEHIMRWPSPWGEGFPGWHLECSAMSGKYLGETFDIHGGGMDLLFPHHECEIAQSQGANKKDPVRYWLHNNMITINGQKMGKSLGNFITLNEFFSGSHKLLEQAYSPMTVRFFILQAHYRSTLDFSNEALKAAQKGYRKLVNGLRTLNQLVYTEDKSLFNEKLNKEIQDACRECYDGMNDDFNSAVSIAALFSLLTKINSFKNGVLNISALSPGTFNDLKNTYTVFFLDILGLTEEKPSGPRLLEELMNAVLDSYRSAKQNKDYATVDKIRSQMKKEGIQLKDTKTGVEWSYEE